MFLPPRLIQLFGMAVVAFAIGFWAVDGRESLLIMSAGMSLIGVGAFSGLRVSMKPESPSKSDDAQRSHAHNGDGAKW